MPEARFQQVVKWGGLVLLLAAVSNLYFLLRYREVYQAAAQLEEVYPQQMATLNQQQQSLEKVIRDFATKAGNHPQVGEILRRHGIGPGAKP